MKQFVQNCPLGNYPVVISLNQVELVRLDNGEFWIVTKSHEIWKKSFFTNSLISYNNKKMVYIFFFFQNFPMGGCLVGISFHQVEVLCLDRGLGGAILDSDKTAWNISELFFYDLLNIVQQKKIGQKYFASLKKWCKK